MARYVRRRAKTPAIQSRRALISARRHGRGQRVAIPQVRPRRRKATAASGSPSRFRKAMAPLGPVVPPESLAKRGRRGTAAGLEHPQPRPEASQTVPWLVITSDERPPLPPMTPSLRPFTKAGAATEITTVHMTTDHSYSDQRIALEKGRTRDS